MARDVEAEARELDAQARHHKREERRHRQAAKSARLGITLKIDSGEGDHPWPKPHCSTSRR